MPSGAGMSTLLLETFYRIAAKGVVPRRWFAPELPLHPPDAPTDSPLRLEIVSHCWRYAPLLTYQLSSLVLHPPERAAVTMTVFFSPDDRETVGLLDFFGSMTVPSVRWNWRPLERTRLCRRAIGRNLAARATGADWIWFTDCDVVFHEGALDTAASVIRDRTEYLLFPREHRVSDFLAPDHPVLERAAAGPRLLDIEVDGFNLEVRDKAAGGLQIVRGDVARAAGYCGTIAFYQRPVRSWRKTYEDRTFRWLLGTHGTPVSLPGLYRIRHAAKGRDDARAAPAGLAAAMVDRFRAWLRRYRGRPGHNQR